MHIGAIVILADVPIGPAIFIVGCVCAAAARLGQAVGQMLAEGRSHRREEAQKEQASDVRFLGQVLRDEPVRRLPGEPLWQNHRLYESLYDQSEPPRPVPPIQPMISRPLDLGIGPSVRRPQYRPPWENPNWLIDTRPLNLSFGGEDDDIPRTTSQHRIRNGTRLEDPFAEGSANGWTFERGRRRRL